jgi:hypothetical protein
MVNYKTYSYNPETFEKTEIETKIPVSLVEKTHLALKTLEGYLVTPAMINPEDLSVTFGVIDMNDRTMKYKVTISPNN